MLYPCRGVATFFGVHALVGLFGRGRLLVYQQTLLSAGSLGSQCWQRWLLPSTCRKALFCASHQTSHGSRLSPVCIWLRGGMSQLATFILTQPCSCACLGAQSINVLGNLISLPKTFTSQINMDINKYCLKEMNLGRSHHEEMGNV